MFYLDEKNENIHGCLDLHYLYHTLVLISYQYSSHTDVDKVAPSSSNQA